MQNALDEITRWALDLPYWEQLALEKLMSGKILDDADYTELLQFLLEDEDLAERLDERPVLHLERLSRANQGEPHHMTLKEISELQNVNALVSNQRLAFGPQLTAIYGLNGSGKSGYARVLGSAGFTRGDRDVLPDIGKAFDPVQPVQATLTVDIDGIEKQVVHRIGSVCPELSSLYVFDSTSVRIHVKGKNNFSFSPAGLSILTSLAKVTDEVRTRLHAEIESLEKPGGFHNYFPGTSTVRELVENLTANTNLDQLRTVAELSGDDERRIHELEVQIGNIGLGRHQSEITKLREDLAQLRMLHTWLAEARKRISPEAMQELRTAIKGYQDLANQAQQLGVEHFQHDGLTQVGTDTWVRFVQSAYRLAQAESTPEGSYPREGDVCLLCHQALSSDAQQLLAGLWEYLTGKTQEDLRKVEDQLGRQFRAISDDGQFVLLHDLQQSVTLLGKSRSDLANRTQALMQSYVQRGKGMLDANVARQSPEDLEYPSDNCSAEIQELIDQLAQKVCALESMDLASKAKELESELAILQHRKKLKELLPQIETYVNQRKWASEASRAGGSTRHITQKYNALFDELVKNRYIEIFGQTLSAMGRPLQVGIVTSGRKGETLKQIQLRAHATTGGLADADKVLSEGEKRAIALADFLTEAALDTGSSGIVLDDPVTSLDLEWRDTIAQLLTREAASRQVIVFTHDLPFLYLLLKSADDNCVTKRVHWIQRGDEDGRPGYVRLDNCPALEQEYRSSEPARRIYARAKKAAGKEQDDLLRDGMAALRTSYEALVIYDLLGGVVQRFQERISITVLTSLAWDDAVVQEIVETYGGLSRFMEGHSHSDCFGSPLRPEMLDAEIGKFDELKRRIKDLKKQKATE